MTSWRSRSDIPNVDGARVHVRLQSGETRLARVVCDEGGVHRLDGIEIADVAGWRPLPPLPSELQRPGLVVGYGSDAIYVYAKTKSDLRGLPESLDGIPVRGSVVGRVRPAVR